MLDENAKKQRDFFNRLAPEWREKPEYKLNAEKALSPIKFKVGERVLDVACGSGALDSTLLSYGLKVDAIDVSDKMIEKAKSDERNAGVNFIVGDFYQHAGEYDKILVFDAYPHFKDKIAFKNSAARMLGKEGELWIFFDDRREGIDSHHGGLSDISVGLRLPEEESEDLAPEFTPFFVYSDEKSYYLGLKRN